MSTSRTKVEPVFYVLSNLGAPNFSENQNDQASCQKYSFPICASEEPKSIGLGWETGIPHFSKLLERCYRRGCMGNVELK